MDHDFLSIKQASQQYDVSDVTLRRLAREITREEGHELRDLIRPGAAELTALKANNKPFEYELRVDLLGIGNTYFDYALAWWTIPEPAKLILIGLGLVLVFRFRRLTNPPASPLVV